MKSLEKHDKLCEFVNTEHSWASLANWRHGIAAQHHRGAYGQIGGSGKGHADPQRGREEEKEEGKRAKGGG